MIKKDLEVLGFTLKDVNGKTGMLFEFSDYEVCSAQVIESADTHGVPMLIVKDFKLYNPFKENGAYEVYAAINYNLYFRDASEVRLLFQSIGYKLPNVKRT